MSLEDGVLVLEGGTGTPTFRGKLFGAPLGEYRADRGYGELVFNTSMTGYQEILTDPSYFGEIVCMTTAHLGNTGVNQDDPESAKVWCAGFVVNDLTDSPSSWRSSGTLDSYLKEAGVPGLTGVDTRALTQCLRSQGVKRALILKASELSRATELFSTLPQFEGRDLIREVTTREAYTWPTSSVGQFRVSVLDFGLKWNLLRSLERRGCEVRVFPATASAEELLASGPQGIFLSNGPGDPAAAGYAVDTVRALVGKLPIFGVCMGHQILGLAMGAKTYKLKFGHRGGNQPVLNAATQRVEISSHNHGYAVDEKTLPRGVRSTHQNLNDHTCEGLEVEGKSAFSVQYHPEACPGPHDSEALFDHFVGLMAAFQGEQVVCTKST